MSADPGDALRQRYARALRLTAPKLAATTPNVVVEGYWIDRACFYFLAEKYDASMDRIVSTPALLDAATEVVEELFPLEVLLGLVSDAGARVSLEALSHAQFAAPDESTLAVSLHGKVYLLDRRTRSVRGVRASLAQPALYSPDGHYACLIRGHDLALHDRDTGLERLLTLDGETHFTYGQPSETALAAVSYRRCPYPLGLWSPDSQWFLTHRIDERHVPEVALVQHAPPYGGRPVLHRFKYAIPGDPLPTATLVAIHVASGRRVAFSDWPLPIASFSPFSERRIWFGQAGSFWLLRLNRYCKDVEIVHFDLERETGRVVLRETVESGYIDLNPAINGTPNIRTLEASNELIWYSQRDGWGHLYLYDAVTGQLKNRITQGDWVVRDVAHVNEEKRELLILASGIDPTGDPAWRSLCKVSFDGTGFAVLCRCEGDVYVPTTEPSGAAQNRPFFPGYRLCPGISPDGQFAIVRFGSTEQGNETKCVNLASGGEVLLAASAPTPDEVAPRRTRVIAADGKTRLHGLLMFPSDFDPTRRYPLIDYIYPGPQIAWQPQHFRSLRAAFAQSLAQLGFVTLMLDTRGTPISSRAAHQVGYGNLLEPQLADHAAAVRELCQRYPFIDGTRIGIVGQSGGGAAVVRALCDYGELFTTGVAVCGNHNSTAYASVWSDKYRGPEHSRSWAQQANEAVAHRLQGKLFLISGDMDENVLVSQTLSLAGALANAHKDFEMLIVPNAGHDVLSRKCYVQRRIWDYFVRNLLHETPPADFGIDFAPHELERLAERAARESR